MISLCAKAVVVLCVASLVPSYPCRLFAQDEAELSRRVDSFVCGVAYRGAPPYLAARRLGAQALKRLTVLLNDEATHDHRGCSYNAAVTLGILGTPEAVAFLKQYLSSGKNTTLSENAYAGRSGAILGLGFAANRENPSGSARKAAFDHLRLAMSNDKRQVWTIASVIGNPPSTYGKEFDLHADLTQVAIQAVGLVGSKEAEAALAPNGLACGAFSENCQRSRSLNQSLMAGGKLEHRYPPPPQKASK